MARIVFGAAAYLGDVAPYVPAANALATRGHDVVFLTPTGFHGLLAGEHFSLATYPLDFSPAGMHADPLHERLMRHPWRNVTRLSRYWMQRSFFDDPVVVREAVVSALAGADVAVSHPIFATVMGPVAEHLGIPFVVGHMFPMMVPTGRWSPPIGSRSPNLGRVGNAAAWKIVEQGARLLFYDRGLNELRHDLGLAPIRANALLSWTRATRTVMLVSRHYYGEAAPDWPPITWGGFSIWPGPANAVVDPVVDEFVDGGEPPVLVTLGTSAASGAGEQFATIRRGLDARDLRSILLVGDERNLAALPSLDGAFAFAPLVPLLPRCRAAVVSGALGALAAALSAGVPVVVVPQLFDQVWHGRRVEDLGVGIMVRRARDVAGAVARLDGDPRYRKRARALAARMATEDGARVLADVVESLI
jgi:UDP:flavonoid glycosyltransferase YjiC (YdhE family)